MGNEPLGTGLRAASMTGEVIDPQPIPLATVPGIFRLPSRRPPKTRQITPSHSHFSHKKGQILSQCSGHLSLAKLK
jgi:hypothetical protein